MYQTPRSRIGDARDEQRKLVQEICANMGTQPRKPKALRTRTVWNECLQRWVEVR
jgi:hypothetical protein